MKQSKLLDALLWTYPGASLASDATTASTTDVSPCKLPAPPNVYLSLGFNYTLDCAPSTGTLTAFMFFVDFPDAPGDAASETPQSLHDAFLPAAAAWYATASYGRLRLDATADTTRFYRMPARSDSYPWARGLTAAAHRVYIQDALAAFNQTLPRRVDVLYIAPTTRAANPSFSSTYMSEVRARGGAAAGGGGGGAAAMARKTVTFGADAYKTWKFKTLNHETGHAMCLPDLYPLPSGSPGLYVGGWDLMGFINGPAPDYFAWSKWRLGWLDDARVACVAERGSSVHTLTALGREEAAGGIRAVVARRNGTAVLVAEARTKAGLDSAACAAGVLLYTVSTALESGKGQIRVLDATPRSGGCARDELNDAPLLLEGTKSYTVPDWGVKVTVTEQAGDLYTIQVDVP